MDSRDFVELCARTAFSGITVEGTGAVEGRTLLDAEAAWPGAGQPEEVMARAALLGQDAVAVCDLDTVAGVVRAYSAGREHGVRLIPGVELLLQEGALALHSATPRGWAHLCEILTLAKEGLDKDDVDHRLERVLARAEGLYALALPPFDAGALGPLKDAFGPRLSLAVAFHKVPEDQARLAFAREQAAHLGAPIALSARPFLVDAADKRLHDVLTCIRQHLTLQTAGQRLLPNAHARMRGAEELAILARGRGATDAEVRAWMARTREIADACTFELGHLKYRFPTYQAGADANALLRQAVLEGARHRYPAGVPAEVSQQLEHELGLIAELDVAPYFLTVKDIVDLARDKGILCQGRGSAANSAVCWVLGVTSIDPVRTGLLFERFLSKERHEPPDIDVDFEHERREEVIQAIYDKYGRDHSALVSEVISYRGRSAVREVGKVYGLSEAQTAKIADLMLHSSFRELSKLDQKQALIEAGLDVTERRIGETLRMAQRLQGHPRHLGIHVGGFVLTEDPITTLGPVEPARMADRTILPWDKDDVEALGLFKMDVLGLGMLTCIRKCLDLLNLDRGSGSACEPLFLHTIPPEDPAVYEMLGRADSIGVFQVESRAQMAMLPRLKPRCFYDLVVEVALIRPGPIQGGMVHPYLRRRNGEEAVEYPHESLKPILERTLGVPLFQEQVMKLAIVGAGYSGGEADQLRRDMAAWKKTGKLMRHRQRLIDGFLARGISRDFAERLFEQIKGFGEYGFPESHAASFAILVYASAWLKAHHPAHFACALLNSLPMGFYAPQQILADAQRHGVPARPLDINHSGWDHRLEPSEQGPPALRVGLRLVRGLPEELGRGLEAERQERGPYVDVSDVSRRLSQGRRGLDKKTVGVLARAGAFDSITPHRRAAVWASMTAHGGQRDKKGAGGRPPLLRHLPDDDVSGLIAPPPAAELLLLDYDATGVSLSDHPMRHLRPALPEALRDALTSAEVSKARHGTRARVVGLVIGRQRPGTADGTCFVTLEDEHGHVNVVIWGRDFDRWRHTVVTAQFLMVEGVIERQANGASREASSGQVVHLIAHGVGAVRPRRGTFGGGAEERSQLELPFASRDFH